jgi:tRNA(fMet)-specific endonuclease VapC
MSQVLLDTDILSEVLKRRDAVVVAAAERYLSQEHRFTLSALTVFEVMHGLLRKGERQRAVDFSASLFGNIVLPFDVASAEKAAEVLTALERSGRRIDLPDVMIAGIALSNDLPIVTGNVAHFESVRAAGMPLEILNWRNPTGH